MLIICTSLNTTSFSMQPWHQAKDLTMYQIYHYIQGPVSGGNGGGGIPPKNVEFPLFLKKSKNGGGAFPPPRNFPLV